MCGAAEVGGEWGEGAFQCGPQSQRVLTGLRGGRRPGDRLTGGPVRAQAEPGGDGEQGGGQAVAQLGQLPGAVRVHSDAVLGHQGDQRVQAVVERQPVQLDVFPSLLTYRDEARHYSGRMTEQNWTCPFTARTGC